MPHSFANAQTWRLNAEELVNSITKTPREDDRNLFIVTACIPFELLAPADDRVTLSQAPDSLRDGVQLHI